MIGVNQRATNIQKATVTPTSPVLPPSLIPVADSAHEQGTTSAYPSLYRHQQGRP